MALGVLGALLLVLLWEGYKALGQATDDRIGPIDLPAHTDDLSMPHVWTILGRFNDPGCEAPAARSARWCWKGCGSRSGWPWSASSSG